ncbi:MAG: hypothetical protein K8T20_13095 [Planctomycetes bacterium]|nr:hypothetical protein [Planctomycetota bacterium]
MSGGRAMSGRITARTLLRGFGASGVAAILVLVVLRGTGGTVSEEAAAPVRDFTAGTESPVESSREPSGAPGEGGPRVPSRPAVQGTNQPESARRRQLAAIETLNQTLRSTHIRLQAKLSALGESYRVRLEPALETFSSLLQEGSYEAGLRAGAVQILATGASIDPEARRVLAVYAGTHGPGEEGRTEALVTVLRCGNGDDLNRCAEAMIAEKDEDVIALAARGLSANDSPAARSMLAVLSANHPDLQARLRAEDDPGANADPRPNDADSR